jgi:hypothetical protein
MSGNSREWSWPQRKVLLGPEPASRRPLRGRLHGTCDHRPLGTALGAKYPVSSPPTKRHPGEQTIRPLVSMRRNPHLHHLDLQKISCVSSSAAPRGPETKTPPEHRLGRGSITRTCGTASGHSASARKHARTEAPLALSVAIQRLHDEWACALHRLSRFDAGANRQRRVRCMIAVRGEVKASKQKLFVRIPDARANVGRARTIKPPCGFRRW